jgi:chromosome segregation ATPase
MMMKVLALLCMLAVASAAVTEKDSTITKVVKLLQGMLEKSKAEGDAERKIYAKFKCYCDTSEAEKTKSIEDLTEEIQVLESKIAEVQGATGELSSECAQLKADMASNEAAQKEATALRGKENKAFLAEEQDLTDAIAQMKSALEVLSAVGGDQTKSTGADNKQFMAGKASLMSLQSQVQNALKAASALMNADQRRTANAFLQAPFTGTYTSQSAQVVGIIKSMRDTFKKNLGDARKTEKDSLEAYDKFMEVKEKAFKTMKSSYEGKQKDLGANDGELASKKKQLSEANKQKTSDEEFMDSLLPMCKDKAEGYANRKLLRANEDAAIAEAISILNSDDAFAAFGTTSATKTGATKAALVELRTVNKHMNGEAHVRQVLQTMLQSVGKATKSARISKVLALLQAENPFESVLGEISKMIALTDAEGKADKEKLDWCKKERTENNESLEQKKKDILALEGSIDKLTTSIEDPKTGLKKQIEETELSLVQNTESQTSETKERTEDNVAYQSDIRNLVSAQDILSKALKVLKVYYDDLEKKLAAGEAFVQKKEDPKPPEAWKGDGDFAGQSSQGGDVIKMLEFILSETNKEEMQAHKDEEKSQADYEDSMTKLKKEEAAAEKSLAGLQSDLATAQKDLLDAQEDLKATTEDKESIEVYLLKIKPGCDFITTNYDDRVANRKTEKTALEKAVGLIKATPAYMTAMNAATVESYGKCKEPCVEDADDVKCKACQSDVTVPAYCAGHKGTKGC